jgi:hypothetical protein
MEDKYTVRIIIETEDHALERTSVGTYEELQTMEWYDKVLDLIETMRDHEFEEEEKRAAWLMVSDKN